MTSVHTWDSCFPPLHNGCGLHPHHPILHTIYGTITVWPIIGCGPLIAGSGTAGFQDGQGALASLEAPNAIAVDSIGNLYVADWSNQAVRKISSSGNVSTIAGTGSIGSNDGQGSLAAFYNPRGVAVDNAGNVYVAERTITTFAKLIQLALSLPLHAAGVGVF